MESEPTNSIGPAVKPLFRRAKPNDILIRSVSMRSNADDAFTMMAVFIGMEINSPRWEKCFLKKMCMA